MCIWRALQCYHHEISLIFIDSRHVFGPAAQLEQVKNFVELLALHFSLNNFALSLLLIFAVTKFH